MKLLSNFLIWLGLLIIIIAFYTKPCEAELIRVKFLIVEDPHAVSSAYAKEVAEAVKWIYKRDHIGRIRYKIIRVSDLSHRPYLSLNKIHDEFTAWSPIVGNKYINPKVHWKFFVAVPGSYDAEGNDYSWGFGSWYAVGTMRQVGSDGLDKFVHDVLTAAHEISHTLGAQHRGGGKNGKEFPNLMHPDVLKYASMGFDLHFNKATRNDIRRTLEES